MYQLENHPSFVAYCNMKDLANTTAAAKMIAYKHRVVASHFREKDVQHDELVEDGGDTSMHPPWIKRLELVDASEPEDVEAVEQHAGEQEPLPPPRRSNAELGIGAELAAEFGITSASHAELEAELAAEFGTELEAVPHSGASGSTHAMVPISQPMRQADLAAGQPWTWQLGKRRCSETASFQRQHPITAFRRVMTSEETMESLRRMREATLASAAEAQGQQAQQQQLPACHVSTWVDAVPMRSPADNRIIAAATEQLLQQQGQLQQQQVPTAENQQRPAPTTDATRRRRRNKQTSNQLAAGQASPSHVEANAPQQTVKAEAPTLIRCDFNFLEAVAIAHMSDGQKYKAAKYMRGPDGFAIAFWSEAAVQLFTEWETEIANSNVNEDGTLSLLPAPDPAKRKERRVHQGAAPKAKGNAKKRPRMQLGRPAARLPNNGAAASAFGGAAGGAAGDGASQADDGEAGGGNGQAGDDGTVADAAATEGAAASPFENHLPWVKEATSRLPEQAQPTAQMLHAGKFAFTLPPLKGTQAKVAAWLKQRSLYVSNLRTLPASELLAGKMFNSSHALQLNYGTYHIKKTLLCG
jgi:hypothetical protein